MLLGFHTQITLVAPARVKTLWMCRHAATNSAGVACSVPHGYQLPFISWPKLMATGRLSVWTPRAKAVMYASLRPAAIARRLVPNGSQDRKVSAPYDQWCRTACGSKGTFQPRYWPMMFGFLPTLAANCATGARDAEFPLTSTPKYLPEGGSPAGWCRTAAA